MRKILIVIGVLFAFTLYSQEDYTDEKLILAKYNDSLKHIVRQLYAAESDELKHQHNEQLLAVFSNYLKQSGAFKFKLDSLSDIGILTSSDNMFNLYNWNLPLADGTQEYYGFILKKQIKITKAGLLKKITTETYDVFPLIDVSDNVPNPENYVSDNKHWYGMLYYSIIVKKGKNKKVFYTLLGWDGNDKYSKKKIIDVLTFNSKGVPVFGGSIFYTDKGIKKRVVFEHSADCIMTLKYNTKKDSIVFDHLEPKEPNLEGQFQYYCTDFTYDGFGFKKGKWNFGEFIRATNEENKNDEKYTNPNDAGSAIKRKYDKQKWKKETGDIIKSR